jgi:hypothetical protein
VRNERAEIPSGVEAFVGKLIRRGWDADPQARPTFREVFEELRAHEFCVERTGFDSKEVGQYTVSP